MLTLASCMRVHLSAQLPAHMQLHLDRHVANSTDACMHLHHALRTDMSKQRFESSAGQATLPCFGHTV